MKIFFVVDSIDSIGDKLDILKKTYPKASICFFVKDKYYEMYKTDQFVQKRLISIYKKSPNEQIELYIKNGAVEESLVLYSSAYLDEKMILDMQQRIANGSKAIFFKCEESNTFGAWLRNVYAKLTLLIFGAKDCYASTKLQYISAEVMEVLKLTKFKFRLFSSITKDFSFVYFDNKKKKQMYDKIVWNKSIYFIVATFAIILGAFVTLEILFDLHFLILFSFVVISLALIFVLIIMLAKSVLDSRSNY